MPPTLTYPGVYIQELPSGSRTITGVATAVAAFVGRAPRGPVERAGPDRLATRSTSASSAGSARESGLGYAVRDYYAQRRLTGRDRAAARRRRLGRDRRRRRRHARPPRGPGAWGDALEAEVLHAGRPGGDARRRPSRAWRPRTALPPHRPRGPAREPARRRELHQRHAHGRAAPRRHVLAASELVRVTGFTPPTPAAGRRRAPPA